MPQARNPTYGHPPRYADPYPSDNQHQHHYPEAVFLNAPTSSSVTKMTMPVVMFFGAMIIVTGAVWLAATQLTSLGYKIDSVKTELGNQIERLSGNLEARVSATEQRIEQGAKDRWTRKDHDYWCTRTEQLNAGWICAENPGERRTLKPSAVDAWRPK